MPVPYHRTRAASALVLATGLLVTVPVMAVQAAAGSEATKSAPQAAAVHSCTYRSTVGYACDYCYGTAT
ncbi:hypothetical protein J2Z21_001295 [Streptomyces griseochromogenes]|uniref:Uncharacterized protein n=1 Tax=Streptomyces griseochromogenes TaxID=68214 RepID=A0A1B1ATX8_9ACTN|nr:hypothetical protein [Streptomyces griseochromogenes]ANP50024.1 hypothetical protein AVL59_10735 [Streptomyces griseochromogenes]MBP2048371.1 hypothetical protein [Streptomyces griseochromogenes]